MSTNSVTLIGNLTRDPELRFTTGGRGVASFGLAVNRRWQQNGEWQEQVSFFNVVCWGDLGENVATTLNKGSRAIVTGRLEQRSYETSEGEKRNVFEIIPTLRPSGRGELEITDVNNWYVERRQMEYDVLDGFWGDAGESIDAYYEVNDFVRVHGANKG